METYFSKLSIPVSLKSINASASFTGVPGGISL